MTAELLSDEWFAARNAAVAATGRLHHGPSTSIDVVVSGGPSGAVTYHVTLGDGSPPRFAPGPAEGGADATLEQSWAEASAQDRGDADLAVSFMRGETKTKGATRPVYELLRLLAR